MKASESLMIVCLTKWELLTIVNLDGTMTLPRRKQAFIVIDFHLVILTVTFSDTRGKSDKVVVTPSVKPKSDGQPRKIDKGKDDKKSQEQKSNTGKSTRSTFELKIKPVSK